MRRWVLVISAAVAIQLTLAGSLSAASFQGLGFLSGGGRSFAHDVSGDGSVVVGYGFLANGREAFRWTAGGGIEGLGDLAGGIFFGEASSISADGSTIVGFSFSANGREAFRWTQGQGMVGLGDLPGSSFRSMAQGVSADGSTVVGYSLGSDAMAFYWTTSGGMVPLGNGSGYVGLSVEAVSSDGLTVVGWGAVMQQGGRKRMAWLAWGCCRAESTTTVSPMMFPRMVR